MKSTKEALIDWIVLFDWTFRIMVTLPFIIVGVILSLTANLSWHIAYWALPELKEYDND